MEKFLLFTDGGGGSDPLNWSQDEAILLSSKDLISIKPHDLRSIELTFTSTVVLLTIKNGSHAAVMKSIATAMSGTQVVVTIANLETGVLVHKDIVSVKMTNTDVLYYNKIANATQVNVVPINTKTSKLRSMTLCNIHSGAATVTVFLSNSTDNWYIIKDVVIPVGSTLKLDSDELDYDGSVFNLYVKLGGTTPVDVIIR